MSNVSQFILGLLAREDGPTAVEYAVMLVLIVVACISGIVSIGKNVDGTAHVVATAISNQSQEKDRDREESHDGGRGR